MSDIIVEIQKTPLVAIEIEKKILSLDLPNRVIINNGSQNQANTDAIVRSYEAASPINVNRALVLLSDGRVAHADKDNPAHNLDVVGVSRTSGTTGQSVEVVEYGLLTGATFGAISENFFLGNNGQLTSVAPSSGNWLNVGMQISASEFFVNISDSILI